jgi:hypothetical protein
MLCKNALVDHARQVKFDSRTVYVGNCLYMDENSNIVSTHRGRVHSLEDLVRVKTIWRSRGNIIQPEVLFPLELARNVGGLNPSNFFSMDYELWGEFFLAGANFRYTDINFGMFRQHAAQKTQDALGRTASLIDAARRLVEKAECLSTETRSEILAELDSYSRSYPARYWRDTGRLARIGLPPGAVTRLRSLRAGLQRTAKVFAKEPTNRSD